MARLSANNSKGWTTATKSTGSKSSANTNSAYWQKQKDQTAANISSRSDSSAYWQNQKNQAMVPVTAGGSSKGYIVSPGAVVPEYTSTPVQKQQPMYEEKEQEYKPQSSTVSKVQYDNRDSSAFWDAFNDRTQSMAELDTEIETAYENILKNAESRHGTLMKNAPSANASLPTDSSAYWQLQKDRSVAALRESDSSAYGEILRDGAAEARQSQAYAAAEAKAKAWAEEEAKPVPKMYSVEDILNRTSKSAAHSKSGYSYLNMNATNGKKRELLHENLELVRIGLDQAVKLQDKKELERREQNLMHQLMSLDAAEKKAPVSYARGNMGAPAAVINNGASGRREGSYSEYEAYMKEVSRPNVDEYHQLQRLGLEMSFNDYAREKLSKKNKSFAQYNYDRVRGQMDVQRYGDVTVVTNPNVTASAATTEAPCYIFYTSEGTSDFSQQAQYQKQLLEAEGKNVIMVPINSRFEFETGWNNMDAKADEVLILSHSSDRALIFVEGTTNGISIDGWNSNHSVWIGSIRDLTAKEIDTLTVLGCNAGHLDTANTPAGNVAQAFANLGTIGKVVASDGNLGYGIGEEKIQPYFQKVFGVELPESDLFPRLSYNQESFRDIIAKNNIGYEWNLLKRLPVGQVAYYPDGTHEVMYR